MPTAAISGNPVSTQGEEVMKWMTALFSLLPFGVSAADLTCDARFPGGPEGQPVTLTIQIDESGSARIPSSKGTLRGVLTATPDAYRGYVFAESGEKYWTDISRYDGTFAVFPPASSGSNQSVVWGTCKLARQLF